MHPTTTLVETLRTRDPIDPAILRAAWREQPTQGLTALITYERCATWLYRRLGDLGLEGDLPRELAEPLRSAARDATARNLLVEEQSEEVARWLAGRGVPFVFLKGSAHLAAAAAGVLPYAGARPSSDVDVLLPPAQSEEVWLELRRQGYELVKEPKPGDRILHHHFPIWNHRRVAVEVHRSTSWAVSPAEAWQRVSGSARTVAWRGLEVPIPGPSEMLWHSVEHALRDGLRTWILRYLQDAAVVLAKESDQVDWAEIERRLAAEPELQRRSATRWLASAAWLARVDLPAGIAHGTPPCLHRLLRWRYEAFRRFSGRPRVLEKLLGESLNAEVAASFDSTPPGTPLVLRFRRRLAQVMTRGAYRAWSLLQRP